MCVTIYICIHTTSQPIKFQSNVTCAVAVFLVMSQDNHLPDSLNMYQPVIMDVSPNVVCSQQHLLLYIPKNQTSSVVVLSHTGIVIAALL